MKNAKTGFLYRVKQRLKPTVIYRMYKTLSGTKAAGLLRKLVSKCRRLGKRVASGLKKTILIPLKDFFVFRALARRRKREGRPLISVVIPTYQPNQYIGGCVDSVLSQDLSLSDVEVLLCVNGPDRPFYEELCRTYEREDRVRVLYTETKGLAAGRNLGVREAKGDYVTFLDDDDYYTGRFLRDMAAYTDRDTEVVCGRRVDLDVETGAVSENTYINAAIAQGAYREETKYNNAFFTVMTGSLLAKAFLERCTGVDETLWNTEDVVFWAENIGNLRGKAAAVCPRSREAYVRRLTPGSMSRPGPESAYSFYAEDRIRIIERITSLMFHELPLWQNRFLLRHIKVQNGFILRYYRSLPEESEYRRKVREAVCASSSPFLYRSKFGEVTGIAFCHNFAPYMDASAFMAAKRLQMIEKDCGKVVDWTVFTAKMHGKGKEPVFQDFFADFQTDRQITVGKETYFPEDSQLLWAKSALRKAGGIEASVIYSRSMWAGSHMAALDYHRAHPDAVWYAEFSDPLYMDRYNRVRPCTKSVDQNIWRDLEFNVMNEADRVIFTNENQLIYMLEKNPLITEPERIREKSLVWHHNAVPERFVSLLRCEYNPDPAFINVGYFGTFYKNRNSNAMLPLLERPDVALHVFSAQKALDLPESCQQYAGRVHLHAPVDHMSFLNAASRFDYLFIDDIDFPGEINPHLPSKYADYRITGTPILVKVNGNSILSKIEDPKLIRFDAIDEALLNSLHKKEGGTATES